MNKRVWILGLFLMGIFFSNHVFGKEYLQESKNLEHKISGTVTDSSNGSTLPGVNIVVKGTTIGTTTNSKGHYQLTAPSPTDTLVFSFIGYKTKKVPIKERNNINVSLQTKTLSGKQLVVTGYSSQQKADITGAVSVAPVDDIQDTPTGNPIKSLQGKVSGLRVQSTGKPNGSTNITIRGSSTLGNNHPLFIIDGVPTTSDAYKDLSPDAIESIQVLKDAAAASIYGARASNGVIIITTKGPKSGNFQVNFNSNITLQDYYNKPDMLNTVQRGKALWRASVNDGVDPNKQPLYNYDWHRNNQGYAILDKVNVIKWIDKNYGGGEKAQVPGTNWFDQISQQGVISSNNIRMSTANDRGGGVLSLTYYHNRGTIKGTGFQRYAARVNSNYSFFDDGLKVGENFQVSPTIDHIRQNAQADVLNIARIQQPIIPVYTQDGSYGGPIGAGFSDRENPVRLINKNKWDGDKNLKLFGNLYAKIEPIKNLIFKSSFGVDYNELNSIDYALRYREGFLSRDINSATKIHNYHFSWTWDNTIKYNFDLNQDHHFKLVGGMEAIKNTFNQFTAYREQFSVETKDYLYLNAGTGKQNNSGYGEGSQLLSYFGKVDYDYNSKYLASATLRYDGSSRFGSQNKFGFFPAFSVGWRITNESFFPESLDFISNLKIRYGWGETGNQEIANDARFNLYKPNYGDTRMFGRVHGTAYDLNGSDSGSLPAGFYAVQTGNPDLKWEATSESNFGLNLGLFDNSITGSFDYFLRTTKDILIQPDFIGVVGEGGSKWVNGATVDSHGWEASLNYTHDQGDFSYNLKLNLSSAKDKITKLPPSVVKSYPGNSEKTILGHSQFSLFGYVADGIFQNQQEVDNHAIQPGKGVGRIRYKDLNGDGKITPLDQKYIGVNSPDLQYGLDGSISYKRFSLEVFLQGIQGIEIYNGWKAQTDFTGSFSGQNYGVRTLQAWTPQNKDSNIPALSLSDANNETRSSTYFVENGSYLKLRSAQIGYSLSPGVLSNFKIEKLRVYLRGENLLTAYDKSGSDKFTGQDPENYNFAYPRPRKFILGLNIQF